MNCVGTALYKKKQLKKRSKEGKKWREEDEDGVGSYRELKTRTLGCGERAIDESADL